MALIKDDPAWAVLLVTAARGVDHHQSVIGDDNFGLNRRTRRAFDKAFLVMRASGINAFPASVGQRGGAIAPEQGRQPAGQIAANHVAVMRIGRPARHEMRKGCGASCKTALQGIFQVQQAQIIFAALTHHDLGLEGFMVRINALRLTHQLPLKRFGKGRYPHRSIGRGGPQASRRQISKRLANAGPSLSQHHMRFALSGAWRKNFCRRLGKIALPVTGFSRAPNKSRQTLLYGFSLKRDDARRCAGRRFLPFGQAAEQPSFGPLGFLELRQDQICPRPA